MKVYNITPRRKQNGVRKKYEPNQEIEILEFNMTEGDNLNFQYLSKDSLYFKVNLIFKKHCMSRILCVN